MCKRAVSKAFTEFALKTEAGRIFNKVMIWETAAYGCELLYNITGMRFVLSAVGSYSLVCQFNDVNTKNKHSLTPI